MIVAALIAMTLPSIAEAEALPYPASGTPQPQVVSRRSVAQIAQRLTLDQAIAVALARVPSLAAARASIAIDDASVQLDRAGLLPSVSATVSSTSSLSQYGSTSTSTSTTTTGSTASNTYSSSNSAGLSLSQLIFDGGKIRAEVEAATQTRNGAAATARRQAETVAYNVASTYYALLADQRTVAVDLALVRDDELSEKLVRAQIRAGTTAGVDLSAQESTTANARTTLVTAQGAAQTARVAFATALGLDADADVTPIDDSTGLEAASPTLSLPAFATELGIAYVERGDLASERFAIASANATLQAASRGLVPTVSLSAAKSLASSDRSGGAYRNAGSLGVTISIPIYDQGVTKANVASAKATLALDRADTATLRSTVQSDVRGAMIALVSDRSTLDEARAAYASAQSSFEATQGQYRVGVTTLPALIDAETTVASASTNIVSAIYTFKLAQVELRYAIGTNLQ